MPLYYNAAVRQPNEFTLRRCLLHAITMNFSRRYRFAVTIIRPSRTAKTVM